MLMEMIIGGILIGMFSEDKNKKPEQSASCPKCNKYFHSRDYEYQAGDRAINITCPHCWTRFSQQVYWGE